MSQEDREAIISAVVRELKNTSLPGPSGVAVASSGEAHQGTSRIIPSFASTFSMPTTLVSTGPVSSPPILTSSVYSCSAASPNIAPIIASALPQPFVIGPGSAPVPAKVVAQILSGNFVDLAELINTNLIEGENEPQVFLDGRVVLSQAPKRNRRKVEDIVTWIETFTTYTLVLVNSYPNRWRDLTRYKMLILRTYRQFGGKAWLAYDKAFREHAAASKLTDWSTLDAQLYSFHTAGSAPRHNVPSSSDEVQPKGSKSTDIVCRSWNRGQCSSRYTSCRFAHACSACKGEHKIVDCPDFFRDQTAYDRKRDRSPDAGHTPASKRR